MALGLIPEILNSIDMIMLMSNASFYKWRTKFGGMDASMMSEMKSMAEENRRLKRMYAEMSMQNDLLKEALGKKP